MYGTRRVVLSPKLVAAIGKKRVTVAGGKSHHPMGFWYELDGKFFADLRSPEQWYQGCNSETLGLKGFGGVSTQKELRELIMAYWKSHEVAA